MYALRISLLWVLSIVLGGPSLAQDEPPEVRSGIKVLPGLKGLPDEDYLGEPTPRRSERAAKPFRPLAIQAEVYREGGPPLTIVSETSNRHFALSADGDKLFYIDASGLWVAPSSGGKPHRIDDPAPFFRISPDASWVLIPGVPWTRLSVSGRDGPIEIAPRERAHQLSGVAVSNSHLAFVSADGPLVVASLVEGSSNRMPIKSPEDRRCHAGAGFPRSLSDDGRWMILQHGCGGEQLIRTDGTDRRDYSHVSSLFVDDYLVGSRQYGSGEVEVIHLASKERWRIEGISLSPRPVRVPGKLALLQLDAQQRLVLIDLKARSVRRLHESDGRVNGFIDVTADGSRGLYATQHEDSCAVHQVDLGSGRRQQLALVANTRQCFIHAIGTRRAVLYAWSSHESGAGEAILAAIDLETGVVTRVGPIMKSAGSLQTAGGTVALATGELLYMGRP